MLGAYRQSFAAVCKGQFDPSKRFRRGRESLLRLACAIPLDEVLHCVELQLELLQVSYVRPSVLSICLSVWLSGCLAG
jgi:hypothetical protein